MFEKHDPESEAIQEKIDTQEVWATRFKRRLVVLVAGLVGYSAALATDNLDPNIIRDTIVLGGVSAATLFELRELFLTKKYINLEERRRDGFPIHESEELTSRQKSNIEQLRAMFEEDKVIKFI